jgi:hypothetical protein
MRFFRSFTLAAVVLTLAACQTETTLPGEDHGSDLFSGGKAVQAKIYTQGTLPPYPTPLPTSNHPLPATATPLPATPTFTPTAASTALNPTTTSAAPTDVSPSSTASSATQTPVSPTSTIEPTATASAGVEDLTYRLQTGNPARMSNFTHADAGCNWIGVAGQAFDTQGNPVTGLAVSIKGTLGSNNIDAVTITGSANAYGPGGYEIVLGTQPVASTGKLTVQLLDPSAKPLSDKIVFDTTADCAENLILMNFVPKNILPSIYVPLISTQ